VIPEFRLTLRDNGKDHSRCSSSYENQLNIFVINPYFHIFFKIVNNFEEKDTI